MSQMDANGDGMVDYSEFIAAATDRRRLINENNLQMLFELFDEDGNGVISIEELRKVFTGSETEQGGDSEAMIDQVMREVDKNGDQVISQQEFNDVLRLIVEKET